MGAHLSIEMVSSPIECNVSEKSLRFNRLTLRSAFASLDCMDRFR